jgi:hypothetical protein
MINMLETQMAVATDTIKSLEESFANELQEMERKYLDAIERERAAARALTQRQVEPFRARIQILSQHLERERIFIAPIRRMPLEIVTEIISVALAHGVSKQIIASVSSSWRVIILGTAQFWRKICVDSSVASTASLRGLKQTLVFSGSITLDVELNYHPSKHDLILEHFRAIADAGIHRWRSLHVSSYTILRDNQNPILGIFTGSLMSLRSLSINQGIVTSEKQDIFEPLYRLIAATRPCLHNYICAGSRTPEALSSTSIFCELKSVSGPLSVITAIRPKLDIPELHVTGTPDDFKVFELPQHVEFDQISSNQLFDCNLDRVQVLIIRYLSGNANSRNSSNLPIIKFPNLHRLQLTTNIANILPWLEAEAPTLSSLTIIEEAHWHPRYATRILQNTFENEKHRIKISPLNLKLQIRLTTALTILVLKHWSQLQDLTLCWDDKFKWSGNLLSALCKKQNPLCPDLLVLRIVMRPTWPQPSIDAWVQAARRILKSRKSVRPLWRVTLSSDRPPHLVTSITIFDLD